MKELKTLTIQINKILINILILMMHLWNISTVMIMRQPKSHQTCLHPLQRELSP